jgi:GGDEF domain-containing protein
VAQQRKRDSLAAPEGSFAIPEEVTEAGQIELAPTSLFPEGAMPLVGDDPTAPAGSFSIPEEATDTQFDFEQDQILQSMTNPSAEGTEAPTGERASFAEMDAHVDNIIQQGFLLPTTKRESVRAIARLTGHQTDFVEKHYEELWAALERSRHNAAALRRADRRTYLWLTEEPHMAPIVLRDKALQVAWPSIDPKTREFLLPDATMDQIWLELEELRDSGASVEEIRERRFALEEQAREHIHQRYVEDYHNPPTVKQAYQYDPEQNTLEAVGETLWETGVQQKHLSYKYTRLMIEEMLNGENTSLAHDLKDEILNKELELGPPKIRDINFVGDMAVTAAEAAAQSTTSAAAMATTLLLQMSPVGRKLPDGMIKWTGLILNGASSAVLENADMYRVLSKMTIDGERLDRDIVWSMSIAYAVIATTIENLSFGSHMRAFQQLKDAPGVDAAGLVMKRILQDPHKVRLAKDLAQQLKRTAKFALGRGTPEAIEEFMQSMSNSVLEWLAGGVQTGQLGAFNTYEATREAFTSGAMGFLGGIVGFGGAFGTVNFAWHVATSTYKNQHSQSDARGIEKLYGIAKSDTAKSEEVRTAPQGFFKWAKGQLEDEGVETDGNVYMNPMAFEEKARERGVKPADLAREIMGPEGPARLEEAKRLYRDESTKRATLAIPVDEFTTKWGASRLMELLKQDIAARPNSRTRNEEIQFDQDVLKLAEELRKDEELGKLEEPEGAEKVLLDRLEQQLVDTGKYTPNEVRHNMAVVRAHHRMLAKELGIPASEHFRNIHIDVLSAEALANKVPRASRILTRRLKQMDLVEQRRALLIDTNAGVYQDHAFKRLAQSQPAPFVVHLKIEGTKWKNNQGHDEGNRLYRLVGQELAKLNPNSGKVGGDFAAYVDSPETGLALRDALAQAVAGRLQELNPSQKIEGLQVQGAVEAVGENIEAALEAAKAKNNEEAQALEDAKKRAIRGSKPFGIEEQDPGLLALPAEDPVYPEKLHPELVAYSDSLTEQELFEHVYIDGATGHLTARAFFELRNNEATRRKHVMALDLTGLKGINEAFDTDKGDEFLQQFAEMARLAGASGVDFAHLSGDEYAAQHDDPAVLQKFADILSELALKVTFDAPVQYKDSQGRERSVDGLRFGYGIGKEGETYDQADKEANRKKEHERENPGAEADARESRAASRRGIRDPEGGIDLAGGVRPQAYAGKRRFTRKGARETRGAAGRSVLVAYGLRKRALQDTDPAEMAKALQNIDSPTSANIGAMVQAQVQADRRSRMLVVPTSMDTPKKMLGTILDENFGGEGPVASSANSKYRDALHRGLPMPKPLSGGEWQNVNQVLRERGLLPRREDILEALPPTVRDKASVHELSFHETMKKYAEKKTAFTRMMKKVLGKAATEDVIESYRQQALLGDFLLDEGITSLDHAWHLLTSEAVRGGKFLKAGDKVVALVQDALDALRSVPGLEDVRMPESIVHQQAEQQRFYEERLIAQGQDREGFDQHDQEFELGDMDEADVEVFYQPQEEEENERRNAEAKEELEVLVEALSEHTGASDVQSVLEQALRSSFLPNRNIYRELKRRGFDAPAELQRAVKEFAEKYHDLYDPNPNARHRGWTALVRRHASRSFLIFLTEKADHTTFMHEHAHVYFELLTDLYKNHPNASWRLRGDYKRILSWLGIDSPEQLTEEHKEKYARGFEQYLREGIAPSLSLARSFFSFRHWFQAVYHVSKDLNVDLSPEMREVFDRQLATDREIQRVRSVAGLLPAYRTQEESPYSTPEQWRRYRDKYAETITAVALSAQRSLAKAEREAMKAFQSDEIDKYKTQAQEEWDSQKAVRAFKYFQRGEVILGDDRKTVDPEPMKLDIDDVRRLLGEPHDMYTDKKGKRKKRKRKFKRPASLEAKLGHKMTTEESGGVSAAAAALFLGYGSDPGAGLRMLQEMEALPEEASWVEARARALYLEENPELDARLNDLERRAEEALHNSGTRELFIEEETAPGRRRKFTKDERELIREAAKKAAELYVENTPIGTLNQREVLREEGIAANQTIEALAAEEYTRAIGLKRRQRYYHEMWKLVDRALNLRQSLLHNISLLKRTNQRARLNRDGQALLNAADSLLVALGVKVREPGFELPPFSKVLDALGREYGFNFNRSTLERIVGNPPANGWQGLTVADAREVRNALVQIRKAAIEANKIRVENEQVELDTIIQTIRGETQHMKEVPPESVPKPVAFLDGLVMGLRMPHRIIWRMGPTAVRVIWDQYMKARAHKERLSREILEQIMKDWTELPKDMRKNRDNKDLKKTELVPSPTHTKTGLPMVQFEYTRQWLWMVVLNLGNESNMRKMIEGYGWNPENVMTFVQENITDEEMAFIQRVWDLFDEKLFPELSAAHEKAKGLPLAKVVNRPFRINGKTYKGGYFPARYDLRGHLAATLGESGSLAQEMVAGPGSISVDTTAAHERNEDFTGFVLLDWDFVPNHVMSVIHYATMAEFVRNTDRLFRNQEFSEMMEARLGAESWAQLADRKSGFLKAVALGPDPSARTLSMWYKALRYGKSMLVVHAIGLSARIFYEGFVHPLAAGVMLRGEVSNVEVAKAYAQSALSVGTLGLSPILLPTTGFKAMRATALEKSDIVKERASASSRELRTKLFELGRSTKTRKARHFMNRMEQAALVLLDMEDRHSTTLLWTAAYNTHRNKFPRAPEAEAVRHADHVIERAMPVLDYASKAAFLRDRNGMGLISIFYGYMNLFGNLQGDLAMEAREEWAKVEGPEWRQAIQRAGIAAGAVGTSMAGTFIAASVGGLLAGQGPGSDEDWLKWALRRQLNFYFGNVALAGTMGQAAVNQVMSDTYRGAATVRSAPVLSIVERADGLSKKIASGDATDLAFYAAQLASISVLSPIGTVSTGKFYEYVRDGYREDWVGVVQGLSGFGEPDYEPLSAFGFANWLFTPDTYDRRDLHPWED